MHGLYRRLLIKLVASPTLLVLILAVTASTFVSQTEAKVTRNENARDLYQESPKVISQKIALEQIDLDLEQTPSTAVTDDSPSTEFNDAEPSASMDGGNVVPTMRPHASKYTEDMQAGFRSRDYAKPDRPALKASIKNIKISEYFMRQYRLRPGVVQLPDGLLYRVIKPGNGPKPKESDDVSCIYRGRLADDTEFESSANKPVMVHISPLVKGLREALLTMSVGSKIEAVIPPAIGFGMKGKPPKVGPNSLVIYELELQAIVLPSTAPSAQPKK